MIAFDDLSERDRIRLSIAWREVKPVPKRPTQDWATRALLAEVLSRNYSLAQAAVFVVLVSGMDDAIRTEARTKIPGDSVWKLLYEWDAAQPYMHLTPATFRDGVLAEWASMANVLRARIRYEQRGRR